MTKDQAEKRASELNKTKHDDAIYAAGRYHDKTDVYAVFRKYGFEPVAMVEV